MLIFSLILQSVYFFMYLLYIYFEKELFKILVVLSRFRQYLLYTQKYFLVISAEHFFFVPSSTQT